MTATRPARPAVTGGSGCGGCRGVRASRGESQPLSDSRAGGRDAATHRTGRCLHRPQVAGHGSERRPVRPTCARPSRRARTAACPHSRWMADHVCSLHCIVPTELFDRLEHPPLNMLPQTPARVRQFCDLHKTNHNCPLVLTTLLSSVKFALSRVSSSHSTSTTTTFLPTRSRSPVAGRTVPASRSRSRPSTCWSCTCARTPVTSPTSVR